MMQSQPKILINGAGGMGALFGAILQTGGLDVTLLDTHRAHVEAICRDGLKITGFGGDRTVRINATTDARAIAGADIILFQCKAYANREAAIAVQHLLAGGAVAVSFQNGLGNEEAIGEILGADKVLGGLTTMAGQQLAPGKIRDFARVPSYIGELNGGLSARAETLAATLTAAGLETHASADIRTAIWKKLLGNIALSALSGATDLSSAEALRIPALKATSLRALDEALAVAASQNIRLDREEALQGLAMISAAGGTGDNKSSLCVDLLQRRPTEVDYIYGTVIELGREANIATPTLATLAAIVKGKESHYLS